MPSSGNASRLVTRTSPVAVAFRRNGSNRTAKPAPSGIIPSTAEMIETNASLKKRLLPRGSHPSAFAGSFMNMLDVEEIKNVADLATIYSWKFLFLNSRWMYSGGGIEDAPAGGFNFGRGNFRKSRAIHYCSHPILEGVGSVRNHRMQLASK